MLTKTEEIRTSEKCGKCTLREVCNTCAACALLETGSYDGVPDYICRYTKKKPFSCWKSHSMKIRGLIRMDKIFRIGTFCFGITNVEDILIPANFLLFEISDAIPEFIYHLNVTNNLPLPGNKILASRDDLTIYKTMDGEERFIGMKGLNSHYAYYPRNVQPGS